LTVAVDLGEDVVCAFRNELTTLTLTIAAASISESDGSAATTATVSRSSDTTSALTVDLASDDTSEATVPASLTIAAGQTTSAPFDIDAVDDAIVDGTQTVTITGSAAGHTVGSDTVDVTDDEADLAIRVLGDGCQAIPGASLGYTIKVSNLGPSDIVDAQVADIFPGELIDCKWSCVAAGSASCAAGPVPGDISDLADLPAASSVTYTAQCTVDPGASFEQLSNTATVTAPAGATDPVAENNSDTVTNAGPLAVFVDCFESGNTTSWSSSTGGNKRLVTVVDPGDEVFIELLVDLWRPGRSRVTGLSAEGEAMLYLELEARSAELWVTLAARLDDGSWVTAEPVFLAGGSLTLGLEWQRAVALGIDNGEIYLMADGVIVAWLTELDTDEQTIREVVAVGNLEVRLHR
jgi:uncharacterized repeat protein (TIGR01451 family)